MCTHELTLSNQVQRIVCKSAWGKTVVKPITADEEGRKETVWFLVHDQLTFTRPENPSMLANLPEGEASDNVISYQDYLEECYPKDDEGNRSEEAQQNIAAL